LHCEYSLASSVAVEQTMFEQDDSGAALTPHGRSANPQWRGQGLGRQGFDRDVQSLDMLNAYRRNGGLARAADIYAAMQPANGRSIAVLARWIVQREVIHFDWQGDTWLPSFSSAACPDKPKRPWGGLSRN
jgi:hypothetical protein